MDASVCHVTLSFTASNVSMVTAKVLSLHHVYMSRRCKVNLLLFWYFCRAYLPFAVLTDRKVEVEGGRVILS